MTYRRMIYIDESGDPGLSSGSGKSFVMVAVVVRLDENANMEDEMRKMRRCMGWSQNKEFKFHKLRKDLVVTLLRKMNEVEYDVYGVVFNSLSRGISSGNMRQEVYRLTLATLLKCMKIGDSRILLDGDAGKKYKRSLLTFLRGEVGMLSKRDFRLEDSRRSDGIQLADLIAGTIARSLTDRKDAADCYSIIKSKIKVIKYI